MTQDEIIEMVRDTANHGTHSSGEVIYTFYSEQLLAFAELVAAKEREGMALAQHEPLEYWNAVEGWVKIEEVREHFDSVGCGTIYKTAGEDRVPVYVTPPQRTWVGLTDEEIQDAGRFSYCRGGTSEMYHIMWNSQPSACIGWSREELIAFTKAVEAKYQEKNQ
jgi:hypothetical protein